MIWFSDIFYKLNYIFCDHVFSLWFIFICCVSFETFYKKIKLQGPIYKVYVMWKNEAQYLKTALNADRTM